MLESRKAQSFEICGMAESEEVEHPPRGEQS